MYRLVWRCALDILPYQAPGRARVLYVCALRRCQTRIRGLLGVGSDPSRPTTSIRISGSVGDAEELPYCFVVVAEVWTSEAHD